MIVLGIKLENLNEFPNSKGFKERYQTFEIKLNYVNLKIINVFNENRVKNKVFR